MKTMNDDYDRWKIENLDRAANKVNEQSQDLVRIKRENAELQAKLKLAVEALEFYADRKNWFDSDVNDGEEFMEIIDEDGYRLESNAENLIGGLRALEALAKLKEVK